MQQFTYTITNPVGIHARPAGLLVKIAQALDSEVTIQVGGKSASARKLLQLMTMGIGQGDTVTVRIQGGDEENSRRVMEQFFRENL